MMKADGCRPQWLSVPAAPDQMHDQMPEPMHRHRHVAQAGARLSRLLAITADHGVARPLPLLSPLSPPCMLCCIGSCQSSRLDALATLARQVERTGRTEWAEQAEQAGQAGQAEPGTGHRADVMTAVRLDLGCRDPAGFDPAVQRFDLGAGTADSRLGDAMDDHQLDLALSAGRHAVERAKLDGVTLIWARGQGLGASTTNQAWWRLLPKTAGAVGRSCGDARSMCHAQRTAPLAESQAPEDTDAAISRILKRHAAMLNDPYAALRCLGGFEHAALVGSALAAAQLGLEWWALGASAHIALLLAQRLNPSVQPWLQAVPEGGCQVGRHAS
ncbi:MAG: nicotinate-nucleotide--dimethylbenzimidazole phosphoribosyltransferase [Lamprobacter sp.]|uniref:nicotinate-nucleotide--dimethylbenzimidazole phosphoribosyltransferase n=1 Tax=Lamprobacter sp. TaxID=3100796 RepID=UPI002B25C5CE|nr:nicotinate-nucleotide--dimethylbenzimidazole phosphoribosyltransferase [Lamprobacter sp.]MEA3640000.1 nicotinate-nucleotide--dimethylbenzimidazole phosphoribosyltransferase [Lamprobacter sp.]